MWTSTFQHQVAEINEAHPFILTQSPWNAGRAPATRWLVAPDWREGVGGTQGPELELAYIQTSRYSPIQRYVHE